MKHFDQVKEQLDTCVLKLHEIFWLKLRSDLITDPQANGTSLEPFVKTRCGDNEFHCNQGDRYLESVVNIFYKVKNLWKVVFMLLV